MTRARAATAALPVAGRSGSTETPSEPRRVGVGGGAVRDVRAEAAVAAPLVRRDDDGDAHLVAIDVVHVHLDRRIKCNWHLSNARRHPRRPAGRPQVQSAR